MYLIYVDESGNTGPRLDDAQQPTHFLVGVSVPEDAWLTYSERLHSAVAKGLRSAGPAAASVPEVHAADVYQGTRHFRGVSGEVREGIVTSILAVLHDGGFDVIYVCSHKPTVRQRFRELARDPGPTAWRLPLQAWSEHLRGLNRMRALC